MNRRILALIAVATTARLALAAVLGLGVDESYAVSASRRLALSYFDHPPLSFWLPGALAKLAGSENGLILRTPFIVLGAASIWLMYRLGARLFGERAGAIGALLFTLAPFFTLAAGSWILPDGPLDFFLLAAALCATRALFDGREHASTWWILTGCALGGAMLSKYHALLFGAGLLLFLLTERDGRAWLRTPWPWLAAGIAVSCFVPVIAWNAQHDWVSFRFQLSRGSGAHGSPLAALAQNLGGQAAYLLPWIWLPLVVVLLRALARGPSDRRTWLLACLAVVPIALFSAAALRGDPGLPHWPMPGYLMLFPLCGASLDHASGTHPALVRRSLIGATAATLLLVALAASHAATGWLARVEPRWFTRGDPALELVDWRDLRTYANAHSLFADSGTFLAPVNWVQGGKAAYALGPSVPVMVLHDWPHQFLYVRSPATLIGHDAVIVIRADARADTTAQAYAPYFARIEPLGRVPITRDGVRAFDLFLFRAHGLLRPYPSAQPQ